MNQQSYNRWKTAFLTLPDTAFFDILRNYLGEFKTPYNKHGLLEGLEAFLRRPDTRRRILVLIEPRDARILTAIRMLEPPTLENLYRFFHGEVRYADLHHGLLNLQDRLLVYPDRGSKGEELYLNPFLEEDLEAEVLDPELLVPSVPVQPADPPEPWLGDGLLTGFLSFLLEEGGLLKSDGSLRKKAETSLRERFPDLFGGSIARRSEPGPERSRVMLLLAALRTLKLLRTRDSSLEADMDAWREFAGLSETARFCLIVRGSEPKDTLDAWREAEWLASFLALLGTGRAYTVRALVRMARLAAGGSTKDFSVDVEWVERLADFDVILPAGEDIFVLNPRFFPENPGTPQEAPVIIQPNFDITVKPGLCLNDGIILAAAARLVRYDRYPHYELSKASFIRALSLGFAGRETVARLSELSGRGLPQNITFSLDMWEKEYDSIALFEGIIILADEDRRHLVDHHKEFRRLVKLNPAPGVYLIDRADLPACSGIFRDAGIEIPPRVRKAGELAGAARETLPVLFEGDDFAPAFPRGGILFPRAFAPVPLRIPSAAPAGGSRRHTEAGTVEAIRKELDLRLADTDLPEDVAGEIRERIRRKLIIFPEQIRPDAARKERTEAKGLNYVGKVLVIEQTLGSSTDYLEIVVRNSDGSPSRFLARPKELRRSGTDLVLAAEIMPEGKALEVPVKKISLVRRLRGFLSG